MASRDPRDLCPLLRDFWPRLLNWYASHYPERDLVLTATYRSPEEQSSIYANNRPGMILTRCDGFRVKSKHNYQPAHAFDVAVRVAGGL
jgi:hypothetical protein